MTALLSFDDSILPESEPDRLDYTHDSLEEDEQVESAHRNSPVEPSAGAERSLQLHTKRKNTWKNTRPCLMMSELIVKELSPSLGG
jgi:hypothetical protein